ncbi:MAG: sigma-70 family RNA polymerase sigma factor [Planctomycetia bacterium]|nr:sigma-70 family RNA polymerase sigma factor [Planctomycetia bacterium]
MTADGDDDDRSGSAGSTSRSLLADAQQSDPAAWVRLVGLYGPLVAVWCRAWGVAEQDVVDVLQDVFAAVARNLGRFRKEQPLDTFRGWLSTIARNKVRDYFRRRAGEPAAAGGTEATLRLAQVLDPLALPQGSDAAEEAALSEVLQRALKSIRGEFHEQTWQAFWSVVVEGRTAADVATELAMQPGTVRVCKSRVLSRLRRELGDVQE